MPRLISAEEAAARILAERGGAACHLCALKDGAAGPVYPLAEGRHATALLSRYARRWGHAMVILREHATSLSAVADEAWAEAARLALLVARRLERALPARRCYIASLGAAGDELPMTYGHLHLHVIPVGPEDRPSAVFQSERGVYIAEPEELAALHRALTAGEAADGA